MNWPIFVPSLLNGAAARDKSAAEEWAAAISSADADVPLAWDAEDAHEEADARAEDARVRKFQGLIAEVQELNKKGFLLDNRANEEVEGIAGLGFRIGRILSLPAKNTSEMKM